VLGLHSEDKQARLPQAPDEQLASKVAVERVSGSPPQPPPSDAPTPSYKTPTLLPPDLDVDPPAEMTSFDTVGDMFNDIWERVCAASK